MFNLNFTICHINKQINDVKAELSNTGNSVYNNTIKNPGITLSDLSEADNETNLDNVNTIAEKGLKINRSSIRKY